MSAQAASPTASESALIGVEYHVSDGPRQRVSLWRVTRAALVALTVLGTVAPASADKAKAEALATEAAEAAGNNDFKTAAQKFSAAFREDPSDEVFCNIGISYYKADELARAHLLLNFCLERTAVNTAVKDNVRTVLTAIESAMAGKHSLITIDGQRGASLSIDEWGSDEVFTGTRAIWLPLGTYHVTGRAEGYRDATITIVVEKPEPQRVQVRLEKIPTMTGSIKPTTVRKPGWKVPAIVVTGGAVGLVVLSLVATGKSQSAADDARLAIDQDTFDDDQSTANTWNRVSLISGGLAVAGAAAAGVLWYRAIRGTEVPVEVTPTAGGASVMLRGRF
jgi:hypothetical protein